MLKTIGTQMTIADYCEEFFAEKIYVNKEYQRSDERWSEQARSFLIESILLGYPLPKFYLYQITDIAKRRSFKEIVDGQQRTAAITDFYQGTLQLSNNFEHAALRGKRYSEIPEELQAAFLGYPLSIDLFSEISPEEIYEVFRRMNSNAQTLTPEEIRHAQFQGEFKWFVYWQGRKFEKPLTELKAFGPRQFIKMLDLRWITELLDGVENGIRTTKGKDLEAIYTSYDKKYPPEKTHTKYLDYVRSKLSDLSELQGSNITRPHMLASLALALIHLKFNIPSLSYSYAVKKTKSPSIAKSLPDLRQLSVAIDQKVNRGNLAAMVEASTVGTNVKKARETRFVYFCELFS